MRVQILIWFQIFSWLKKSNNFSFFLLLLFSACFWHFVIILIFFYHLTLPALLIHGYFAWRKLTLYFESCYIQMHAVLM